MPTSLRLGSAGWYRYFFDGCDQLIRVGKGLASGLGKNFSAIHRHFENPA
jgi:hypothetical protein